MRAAPAEEQAADQRKKRLTADLLLLLVAAIWGSAFVAQRVAAAQTGVYLFNGLRFLLAAAALAPLVYFQVLGPRRLPGVGRRTAPGVLLAGLLLFGGAALQQAGLQYTTAGNAGFITGLYVVLIPIFLAFGWRKRVRLAIWGAALLSVAGMFLLSTGGQLQKMNLGDVLVLIGAFFWALHVILVGGLAQNMDALHLSVGQYVVCGLASLLVGLAVEQESLAALPDVWWTIAYTGLLSVGVGYTLQVVAQRTAPPADAAILLSLEAVFAAFSGWLLLGEILSPVQIVGCGVMLSGMLLSQLDVLVFKESA